MLCGGGENQAAPPACRPLLVCDRKSLQPGRAAAQLLEGRSVVKALKPWLLAIVAGLFSLPVLASPAAPSSSSNPRVWEFSVLLDGDEIGYHRFELVEQGRERRLKSEAKFDVRFLFFNAFRYRHSNYEVWSDGCLREIEAQTHTNGKDLAVSGFQDGGEFIVGDGTKQSVDRDCVMTFAYWNPEFLEQPELLNSQSGEFVDVDIEPLGREPIVVRGKQVTASAYKLTARQLEMTVWYSQDKEWLALESVAKGGRIIRYELT